MASPFVFSQGKPMVIVPREVCIYVFILNLFFGGFLDLIFVKDDPQNNGRHLRGIF